MSAVDASLAAELYVVRDKTDCDRALCSDDAVFAVRIGMHHEGLPIGKRTLVLCRDCMFGFLDVILDGGIHVDEGERL